MSKLVKKPIKLNPISKHNVIRGGKSKIREQKQTVMGFLPKITLIICGFSVVLFSAMVAVESAPNTNLTSVLCNAGVFAKDDPFAISLAYILADLESSTPMTQNYDYLNISPYPNAFAYGHAACNRNLTRTDCKTCLGAATTNMLSTCDSRVGARCVLYDCQIRYEQYPFSD